MCNIMVNVPVCTLCKKCNPIQRLQTSNVLSAYANTRYLRKLCTFCYSFRYSTQIEQFENKVTHMTMFCKCYCAIYCYLLYYVFPHTHTHTHACMHECELSIIFLWDSIQHKQIGI